MKPSERIDQLIRAIAVDMPGHPPGTIVDLDPAKVLPRAIVRYLDEQHEIRQHASEGANAAAEQARASDTERPLPVDGGQYLAWLAGEGPDPCPPCNCDQAQRLERENARLRGLLDRALELLSVAAYRNPHRDQERLELLRAIREMPQ